MNFNLHPEDEEYLNANFPSSWKTEAEGNKNGIIIREYSVPKGIYTPEKSDLMIIVPTDYPTAAIDMFYFCPALARKDGREVTRIASEIHFDKSWQRWSRHYQWEPGKCSVITHISWVANQLKHDMGS